MNRWPSLYWLRSSHLRFIGLILLLQIVLGASLLLAVTQLVRAELDMADNAVAVAARDTLLAVSREQGDGPLIDTIAARVRNDGDAVVLLADRDGRRLAGNLSAWPPNIGVESVGERPAGARATQAELYRMGDAQPGPFGIATAALPGGRWLLAGQRTDDSDQLRATVKNAALTALLMALPLALVGAWLVTYIIDRRIAAIAAAATDVGAGDIDRRVPLNGSGDSFDTLGLVINAMLDRIGRLLGELRAVTDSIAHDLRSPLTRMRARIDRAMESQDPAALHGALEGVSREADQLLSMLSTALEISRMEAGIGRDHFATTDLAAMLEEIGELYEPLVEEQGRRLSVSVNAPAPAAVHRELLGQALSNLIDNALKYGAGAMTLYLEKEEGMTLIGLADEGPGIPPERETEALRRFGRLDPSRGIAGAGLGLSLVAAVARMHGGCLRFGRRGDLFSVELLVEF